jgi:hypothetical protein
MGTFGSRGRQNRSMNWNQVHCRERIVVFHRDLSDGEHAEIVIGDRAYRVRIGDLA